MAGGVLKAIRRSDRLLVGGGAAIARYLRLVWRTTRFVCEPEDIYAFEAAYAPAILTAWHGRHLLPPLFRRGDTRLAVLVSRSRDGEINAAVARGIGMEVIRGSGGRNPKRWVEKGGVRGMLEMLDALENGVSVAMVADVPRGTPGRCGPGIVQLARLSGRPIVPTAAATRPRITLPTYDRMQVPLPYGWGAFVAGVPIHVDRDPQRTEEARRAVEVALDAVNARVEILLADAR